VDTLTDNGHKVAVLAVDPSSVITGGSLLGDKTRMPLLTRNRNAFIRGSPTSGTLGGVAQATCDAISLCECAGYDVILVETVGVGQSELTVSNMVDIFCLLVPPASGDQLQGLKRGVMEVTDVTVITKSDGDLVPAAQQQEYEYRSALKFMRKKYHNWNSKVVRVSSLTQEGIPAYWEILQDFNKTMMECGEFQRTRETQRLEFMWSIAMNRLKQSIRSHSGVEEELKKLTPQVVAGGISSNEAADKILKRFIRDS